MKKRSCIVGDFLIVQDETRQIKVYRKDDTVEDAFRLCENTKAAIREAALSSGLSIDPAWNILNIVHELFKTNI